MSIYYALIPDSLDVPDPIFTRFGRLSKNLETVKKIAIAQCGRVYETTAHGVVQICDYWVEPKPIEKRSGAEYRQARANAALFGVTL